uniref:Uncharacterized protein n=1 Tax=Romanomermis culicivorax TaxID=13658 RepID=A0A915K8K8_ROMCU
MATRMDLIYYISTVILVSIIHGQKIPCHLPDQDKFIFVERSVGKICDPKRPGQLKDLPKDGMGADESQAGLGFQDSSLMYVFPALTFTQLTKLLVLKPDTNNPPIKE